MVTFTAPINKNEHAITVVEDPTITKNDITGTSK